jgi:hypothetical protein
MNRRHFIVSTAGLLAVGPAFANESHTIQVAKTATCGCCAAWVDHIETASFKTVVEDVEQDALWMLKDELGITQELSGCHTALVGGYFVEGHVPASDIQRLLADAPDARGLAVPGMPMGSPGMGAPGAFDVLLVLQDGSTQVYSRHS